MTNNSPSHTSPGGCIRATGLLCLLAVIPAAAAPEIRDHTAATRLMVLFFGDAGWGTPAVHEVAGAMQQVCRSHGCDLALVLGDNIYEAGVTGIDDPKFQTHFEQPFGAFGRFDFWLVAGNHDWRGNVAAQIAYTDLSPRWRQPATHFAVPALPDWLRVYGFDTQNLSAAQIEDARSHFCGSAAPWKIAFGHHPVHGNGRHGDSESLGALLLPLFGECGVQLYLSGHEHHQEHITGRRFEQIISGAASTTRRVDRVYYRPGDPTRQNFASTARGFGLLDLTPGSLTMTFHDQRGRELYRWEATPDRYGLDPRASRGPTGP